MELKRLLIFPILQLAVKFLDALVGIEWLEVGVFGDGELALFVDEIGTGLYCFSSELIHSD